MTTNTGSAPLRTLVLAVALLGPALTGCLAGEGTGTGAIYVKDAPEDDWSHVNVTFTKVQVHQGNESDDDGDGEWITVAENESGREVDLLDFSGADARALLGASELENGTYNQVLIDVTEAYGIDKDSGDREEFELTQDQLRLTRAWQIETDTTTHVVADLDLDRSIREQGDGTYRFNPVIGQVLVEKGGEPGDQRGDGASGGGDADRGPTTTMTTYVKDAPTDELSEVWIEFDEVQVHWAGNASEEESENDTENETDEGAWITTVNQSRELDLLDFNQSDSKAFLGEADVPEGQYTQIRVNITDAWARDNNDTRVNVSVPSGTAKVPRTWNVSANETTPQVTIDLELDRSLTKTGGQGDAPDEAGGEDDAAWKLTPVIGKVAIENVAVDPRMDQRDTEDTAEDTPVDGSGNETGEATTYVKDAPANLSEVHVTFSKVEAHYAGSGNDTENETAENGTDGNDTANGTDAGWRTLFEGERSVDLLQYSEDGAKAFLGDAELETGTYTQIRANVTEAYVVDDNGTRENVTVASGSVKVVRSFTVEANATTQVVIDIDLDKSLRAQGGGSGDAGSDYGEGQGEGSGGETTWRMTPVVGMVLVDHVDEDPKQDVPDEAEA